MSRRIPILVLTALLAGCGKPDQTGLQGTPQRIVSLAPNITETLYALGLGGKLAGATGHCLYPEAARQVPRIGGFGQFNFEAIVSLDPDLVILHREYDAEKARLASLGIPYLETGSYFIADILETIRAIGQRCGAQAEADRLVQSLREQMATHTSTAAHRPRVLMVFGGDDPATLHAFGTECLHHELLEIAGGQNVVPGHLPFATLSREAVLRLDPEIVLVLAPGAADPAAIAARWEEYGSVAAVKNRRVHVLAGDYTCIPGPRFVQTLQDFSRLIRPSEREQNHP